MIWLLLFGGPLLFAGLQEMGFSDAQTPQPGCHQSYAGPCLDPYASDYDCRGRGGDGPLYTGRVTVVGPDVFGLDRDNDGAGCG
jgi:hypothetical protein